MKKSTWAILVLAGIAMASLLLLAYVYRTSLALIRERPPMVSLMDCKRDAGNEVLSWNFDQVNGHLAPDQSVNKIDGILGSLFDRHRLFFAIPQELRNFAVPRQVDHGKGKALEFNGRNWVKAENSKCFTGDKFTIAVWIWKKKEAPPREGDWFVPTIAAKSRWPSSGWWLCTEPNTSNLDMAVTWGESRKHIHSGYAIPAEEWHHVSVTMNKVDHEIQFFIDGKPYGDKHTNVPDWLTNWEQDLYVGEYDGTARWPWVGRLDNFHFYATVLAADEIVALYARERGE